MPDSDDPHHLCLDTVEKAVWRDYHFAIGQIRKLRYEAPRGRIPAQPSQDALGTEPQSARGVRIVALDVRQGREKLQTAGGREPDPHFDARASSPSASSSTSSKS